MITYTIDDVFFFLILLFHSARARFSSISENENSVFRTSRNVINISRDARTSLALRGFIILLAKVTANLYSRVGLSFYLRKNVRSLRQLVHTFSLVGDVVISKEIGSICENAQNKQNTSVFFFAIHTKKLFGKLINFATCVIMI